MQTLVGIERRLDVVRDRIVRAERSRSGPEAALELRKEAAALNARLWRLRLRRARLGLETAAH